MSDVVGGIGQRPVKNDVRVTVLVQAFSCRPILSGVGVVILYVWLYTTPETGLSLGEVKFFIVPTFFLLVSTNSNLFRVIQYGVAAGPRASKGLVSARVVLFARRLTYGCRSAYAFGLL